MLSKILGTQRPQSVSSKGGVALHTSSGNLVSSCWGSMEFTRPAPLLPVYSCSIHSTSGGCGEQGGTDGNRNGSSGGWVIRLPPSPAVSANKGSFRWAAALRPVISSASA